MKVIAQKGPSFEEDNFWINLKWNHEMQHLHNISEQYQEGCEGNVWQHL